MWIIGSSLLELPLAMLEPEIGEARLATAALEEEGTGTPVEDDARGDVGSESLFVVSIDFGDGGTSLTEELLATAASCAP